MQEVNNILLYNVIKKCYTLVCFTFHRGQTLDQAQCVLVAEGGDLHGEGKSRTETLHSSVKVG